MNADIKVNLEKFYALARKDVTKLMDGAAVHGAVIFNATDKEVTFYVYNYIDVVYWIDAGHVKVAPGHYGTVAAAGAFFKVHPNKKTEDEFLVAPGKAYVYEGPGKLESAK